MITRTHGFTVGDQMFASLEEAQLCELTALLDKAAAEHVLKNKDKVLDILTTTSTSKAKARGINGGRKKRAANPTVIQNPLSKPAQQL